MTTQYTAGSFTKNFSWNKSYKRLHTAVLNGFSSKLSPVSRDNWRKHSKINDRDRELIPMNFFLYSKKGLENDYLMVDRLVEESQGSYDDQFAKLALFAFHLSNSGAWKGTKWADGRVAGWANTLIREHAWQKDRWLEGVFQDQVLKDYIADNVAGVRETKTKVFTNYRYMLKSAKVLGDDRDNTIKFREPWYANAIQLFWDRRIFDGSIGVNSDSEAFERSFVNEEIYKLLGCSKEQGLVFSRAAFRQYPSLFANRIQQVESLRAAGAIAA